jgi:hypothetical protein
MKNSYTQYHAAMNVAFFTLIACHLTFTSLCIVSNNVGKSSNRCLRLVLEPFTFLIRLGFIVSYTYFIIWRLLICVFCYKGYHALNDNWWKAKTDPWVTNASYINAVLNWPIWIISLVICVLLTFYAFGLALSVFMILVPSLSAKMRRGLFELVKLLWSFLRG